MSNNYSTSLYKINLPKSWLLHDRPDSKKYLSSAEDKAHRGSLLFHIKKGDYFSTLATVLRFFEEAIDKTDISAEMRAKDLKIIRILMSDLLYLSDNFDLVRKDRQ